MRPIAVILMVVAVIAAGLAAFLAKRWMDAEAHRQDEGVATAQVLGARPVVVVLTTVKRL